MVIEWLQFKVSPEFREKFIQKDKEIWTATLTQFPSFLGKEVWINPQNPEEIILVARWKSYDQWQSLPRPPLEEAERRFAQAMYPDKYELIKLSHYQVRKFS